MNLSKILRENYHNIASRNAQGKTARDVAMEGGFQENADQIGKRNLSIRFCRQSKVFSSMLKINIVSNYFNTVIPKRSMIFFSLVTPK